MYNKKKKKKTKVSWACILVRKALSQNASYAFFMWPFCFNYALKTGYLMIPLILCTYYLEMAESLSKISVIAENIIHPWHLIFYQNLAHFSNAYNAFCDTALHMMG